MSAFVHTKKEVGFYMCQEKETAGPAGPLLRHAFEPGTRGAESLDALAQRIAERIYVELGCASVPLLKNVVAIELRRARFS